jgi:hypothetical protein
MEGIYEHVNRIVDLVVVIWPAVWVGRKWLKRIENATVFTGTVAKIHLPHIYWRLRRSDDALKLPVVEHPSIVFVNGQGGSDQPAMRTP